MPNRPETRPRVDMDSVKQATAEVSPPELSPQEGGYFLNKFLEQSNKAEEAPAEVPDDKPAGDPVSDDELEARVVEALQEIYDPEIPVNIYELGLIYGLDIDENKIVTVTMTLTTPHCPVAESMPGEVELKVNSVPGVGGAEVKLVWEPAWDMSKMSDEARLELGLL
ncbi:SUF system Fe-S cluster assembly protein [Kordiimonas marina]|uniref:SUF system Fe-S cluster assembly protein n=1 Tax=Kordiimonas marina TaxID=2872312 RepID=UPI003CCFF157